MLKIRYVTFCLKNLFDYKWRNVIWTYIYSNTSEPYGWHRKTVNNENLLFEWMLFFFNEYCNLEVYIVSVDVIMYN